METAFIAGLLPVFAGMLARWTIARNVMAGVLFACLERGLMGYGGHCFPAHLGKLFDIMSPLRLMELSYPTQPLLKKTPDRGSGHIPSFSNGGDIGRNCSR